jgi:protoheme IX farnesyltransferase
MYNVKDGASGDRSLYLPVIMKAYIELTKPRITWLILMSAGIGYFFGARFSGVTFSVATGWHWLALLHTILGTGLIASGTAALNQWIEREADAKMRRTQGRPLPSGRITARKALLFGITISAVGFVELAFGVNLLTGLLGLFTLSFYLFVYTPLKQVSPHSTTLGAIPGAMPPLIGYAAASGTLNADAWILFAILFLWQFPHFYAIAWMYREDYERAGILMLPVVEPDGESTARQIFLYSLVLLPISLIPSLFAMTGNLYLVGAIAVGSYYVYMSTRVRFQRTRQQARRVLLASIVYLPALYGLMLIDHVA